MVLGNTGIQEHRKKGIRGSSRMQGYRDTWIQKYRNTVIDIYMATRIQKYRDKLISKYVRKAD